MKKVFSSMCVVGTALTVFSCGTVEKAMPLSAVGGEWNIIEVSGTKMAANEENALPFITLDTATGRMSGNSGCNRMMSNFDINSKPGSIEFKGIGSTKMMCADMKTENNVLNALAKVKKYKKAGKNKMYLCDDSYRPVLVLEIKEPTVKVSILNGEWKIVSVNGEDIPTGMEKQPFIEFNLKENRIHGNAGCNVMNGGFETDSSNAKSISFPGVITTMMACPDMATEGKILKAVNSVKTFDVLSGGGIGFYDADNNLVLVLQK